MRTLISLFAAVLLTAVILPGAGAEGEVEVIDLLVLTETAGFRHGSIPHGVQMLEDLAEDETLATVDFTVTEVANSMGDGPIPGSPSVNYIFGQANPGHMIANQTGPSLFTDENLAEYDVVVWISNTGDVLNDDEQAAFERYIQAGGGYVGIHAAGDSDRAWDWYEDLSGGQFDSHPATQEATIDVEEHQHVSTAHLPVRWTRTDEWYNYQQNPRSYACFSDASAECGVRVLMTMDPESYTQGGGGAMGPDHPIAWCNEWDGGRAWYTGLGHTNESYTEPGFVDHVLGGILTAADIDGLADSPDFAQLAADDVDPFSCEPAPDAG